MDITMLKTHLSQELFDQVREALTDAPNLTIINTAEGAWVPKAKFDEERTSSKSLKTQIAELHGKLSAAEDTSKSAETLKSQVAQLTKDVADRDGKVTELTRSYQIRDILSKSDVRDPDVVLKLLDMSKVAEKEGQISGITEQLDTLKQSASYLFTTQQAPRGGFGGGKPETLAPAASSNTSVNDAIRAAAGH